MLALLIFLVYISGIGENITSYIKLFVVDCLLFRTTEIVVDTVTLQNDLCKTSLWTRKWPMIFNPEKYYTLQIYTTQNPLKMDYVEGVTIEPVSHHPYLGVELQRDLKWKTHIDNITCKANKTIGLTKRSLHTCSQVKARAYTTLARPKLEYSSAVCNPCRKYQINQIEKIQHRAARFVLDGFSRESSVTSTLVFHKPIHHKIAVSLPDYLKTSTHHTRLSDCCYSIPTAIHSEVFKYSFVPRRVTG